MKSSMLLIIILMLCGCTAPFHISDRPSYGVMDQFKNKFQAKDKLKLEINQQTKELRIAKGPSGMLGAATIYEFNLGEAFSGHLTEIANNIFIKDVNSPLKIYVKIDNCDFSYANTMVHILAWAEIDMTVSVKYFSNDTELKTLNYKYHSRVDVPFSERVYGVQADRAAVSAVDEIVEQLLTDVLKDLKELDKA